MECISGGCICADIKPSNLLLDKGTVKLADFGASATVKLGENNKCALFVSVPSF
jgi:serine/threonine protein kinase